MANIDIEAPGASDASLRSALQALYPAHSGASVGKASASAADYTAGVLVGWDSEFYDNGGWHDNVTNNSRLTVPSGVTRVDLETYLIWTGAAATSQTFTAQFYKNGSGLLPLFFRRTNAAVWYSVSTLRNIVVVPGDYFQVHLTITGDTSVTLLTDSYFKIRASEFSA
jgi:hypothetical protein